MTARRPFSVIEASRTLGVDQLFMPAEVAMLPSLVNESQLVAANSLSSLNRNLARLIGPAVGAAAVAFGGLPLVVLVDGVSFLGAAVLIARGAKLMPDKL